ncbi:MAG: hypothetical protein WBN30_07845 [Polyangiales bacterium]
MRLQRKRRKGGRTRRQHSELDWFAEDPWAETEGAAAPLSLTDWQQDLAYFSEDDLGDVESSGDDDWGEDEDDDGGEDDDDDWGPIRPRRGPPRRP